MNAQSPINTDTRLVPLEQLYLHTINPRQNGSDADTDAMARSIAVNGLMQNLMGFVDPEHPGKIGIVAGGRRLAGLQLLKSSGSKMADSKEPDWDAIPVHVTKVPMLAQSWAASEFATQQPLNPADEISAYGAMADQGSTPDMIARAFAQTERHVKGRLALVGLIPEAREALRAGHISLDVAKALTLAKNEERQLSVLTAARAGNWNAHYVRSQLTSETVRSDDRKVRLITVALYQAEGGTIDSDLFEDHVYLHDRDLVDRLFTRELAAKAEALRETEGWLWVKTTENAYDAWDITKNLSEIYRTSVELPEGDLKRFEELEELYHNNELDEQGQIALNELQARQEGDFTDEDREIGGIVVLVNQQGELTISGAYREGSKSKASNDAAGSNSSTAPKPSLSQAGTEDLGRISLLALQGAMLDKTEYLLDLLAWQMDRGAPSYSSPFAISLTSQNITPEAAGSWHIDERLVNGERKQSDYNEDTAATFATFQALSKKHRNQVLARGLVRTLQRPAGSMAGLGQVMAEFSGVSIRKVWTPDGPTYFSRLSAAALEAIWAALLELESDDKRHAEFSKLKKAAKVKELSDLFSDASTQEAHGLSREQVKTIDAWLPTELRQTET